MEFVIAGLVGAGLLVLLIVVLAPSADHGRRPVYRAVGLDPHRKRPTRRARTAGSFVVTGASVLTPIEVPAAPEMPRTLAEFHADQLVAGLVSGSRR